MPPDGGGMGTEKMTCSAIPTVASSGEAVNDWRGEEAEAWAGADFTGPSKLAMVVSPNKEKWRDTMVFIVRGV